MLTIWIPDKSDIQMLTVFYEYVSISRLLCLNSPDFTEKALEQSLHLNGFSRVWTLRCRHRSEGFLNSFSQKLHKWNRTLLLKRIFTKCFLWTKQTRSKQALNQKKWCLMQWGFEIWPLEIRKHLKKGLFEGGISNGQALAVAIAIIPKFWKPDHSKSRHFCLDLKWFLTKWWPFVLISNGWTSRFQIPFKILTICALQYVAMTEHTTQMSRLRQVTRQVLIYLKALSCGIITILYNFWSIIN